MNDEYSELQQSLSGRKMTASKQKTLRKVLYHHDWTTLEEWAKNLDELAELDDRDIEKLLDMAVNDRNDDLCA